MRRKVGGKYDRRMSFDDVKDERMLVMVDKLCVWMGGILGETLNRENLIPQIRHVYSKQFAKTSPETECASRKIVFTVWK